MGSTVSEATIRNHAAFIWSVADLLRGDYKQSEYGKVILPLVVLRRLDCVLEPTKAIEATVEGKRYPVCLDGARACPPEDCGGIPGYERLLAALADPKDPEHDELVGWAPDGFDPELFDLIAANRRLRG